MLNFSSFFLSLRSLVSKSFTKPPKVGDVVWYEFAAATNSTDREKAVSPHVGAHRTVITHVDHFAREAWVHAVSHKHPHNPPKQPAWWYYFGSGFVTSRPHIVPFVDLQPEFKNVGKILAAQIVKDSESYGRFLGWKIGLIKLKAIPTMTAKAAEKVKGATKVKGMKNAKGLRKVNAKGVKKGAKVKAAKTVAKAKATKVQGEGGKDKDAGEGSVKMVKEELKRERAQTLNVVEPGGKRRKK